MNDSKLLSEIIKLNHPDDPDYELDHDDVELMLLFKILEELKAIKGMLEKKEQKHLDPPHMFGGNPWKR